MPEQITIALDAMGGDHGPDVVVPAAIKALDKHPDIRIILVGRKAILQPYLDKVSTHSGTRLTTHHASEVVAMDESPAFALRRKKDSSMRVAVNLVSQGVANACVSAGNTGALMAMSRSALKMLTGIDRPAIIGRFPSINGHTYMLDLGANVDSKAEHLRDFAVMGSVVASAVDNIENPSVALLNIGEESIKGNEQVKRATQLLSETNLNYVGYAEGGDIYCGNFDVIVCDGFVGNISLKSSEGVVKLATNVLQQAFSKNRFTRLAEFIAMPVLKTFKKTFDLRRYSGASLVGLRGIVVKSHGGADAKAFANSIDIAVCEVEKHVPEAVRIRLEELFS